jgi:ADP-ribosylglycohydrolase
MTHRLSKNLSQKAKAGIMGFIVGDALGVPYEFRTRDKMKSDPASSMTGYGTHNQPPGTWSDDTSMMLCVLENCHRQGTVEDLGRLFLRWYDEGYHTAHGEVFDIGITTERALERLKAGNPLNASEVDERRSSGNGSLMRSLPYAFLEDFQSAVSRMSEDGRITHPVAVCDECCGFYVSMARSLAEGASREEAYRGACEWKRGDWQVSDPGDSPHEHRRGFARLFSEDFKALREDQIRSGGYVLETLEAVVWCLLRGRDYKDCVLNAVNLGQDTDTIAALTGGLAGIHWGLSEIPAPWLNAVVGREHLESQVEQWLDIPDAGVR